MMISRALALLALGLLIGLLGTDVRSTQPDRTARTARHTELSSTRNGVAHQAVAAVDRFARDLSDTTLGVVVLDRRTGEVADGNAAASELYSASVVKLIVAVDMLQRRHTGLTVDQEDFGLLRRALGPSDDDAMNVLWTRFDGEGAVRRVSAQLRLNETRPPETPGQWGDTTLSARDVTTVFEHIMSRLPVRDRKFIMGSLAAAPGTATGGFDQKFGLDNPNAGDPPTKAGWMCCTDGMITLHSAGVVDHRFVIALLSEQPSSVGYSGARETLTEAAKVLREKLH